MPVMFKYKRVITGIKMKDFSKLEIRIKKAMEDLKEVLPKLSHEDQKKILDSFSDITKE